MNLKIFVCYHNDYVRKTKQDSSVYIPLYATEKCKKPNGFLTTNGNEISKYNDKLSEGTVLYWLVNNFATVEEKYGKIDYVGFEHYRRWFENYEENLNSENILGVKQKFENETVFQQFKSNHPLIVFNLNECLDKLIEFGWFSTNEKEKYLLEKYFFKCNMFIMPRDAFIEYGRYLNECIKILIEMIDSKKFSENSRIRDPAYILERLTGLWLFKLNLNKKYNIIPTKISM